MIDRSIIKRCFRNDTKAQRLLYDHYKNDWYAICLRYLDGRETANDILQNSLIKIFSKISTYDENKGQFSSWSNKIVVNECLSYLRSSIHKRKFVEVDTDNPIIYDGISPVDNLSAEELTKIIQNLPDGYRAVFNLFAVEGFTHKEIAERLNISEGTSKSQYFKARKMLQKKVEYLFNYRAYERI